MGVWLQRFLHCYNNRLEEAESFGAWKTGFWIVRGFEPPPIPNKTNPFDFFSQQEGEGGRIYHEDKSKMQSPASSESESDGSPLLYNSFYHDPLVWGHTEGPQAQLWEREKDKLPQLQREWDCKWDKPERGSLQLGDRRWPLPFQVFPHWDLVFLWGKYQCCW